MPIVGNPTTGGEYVQSRNRRMLKTVFEHVDIVEIPRISIWRHALNVLLGRGYGCTYSFKKVLRSYLSNDYDIAFLDSSSYGYYVSLLKDKGFKTIVFCHNVEYEYYKAKFESKRSLMNRVLVPYIKKQEQLSMKNATYIITLNKRDSVGFKQLYHRETNLEIPISYESKILSDINSGSYQDKFLLFVGADFYANTDGILWFIKNVSNHIKYQLYVAGGCCKTVSKSINLSKYPHVKLLGFVDDLDTLYKNALGVVCPIFSGSGMKTKTIEALKYGKSVFGTTEAFEGIEVDFSRIGGLCNTEEDFTRVLSNCEERLFNSYSYSVFESKFSNNSVFPKFTAFVNNVVSKNL